VIALRAERIIPQCHFGARFCANPESGVMPWGAQYAWSFRGEIMGRRPMIENPESSGWIPGSPTLRFGAPE